MSDFANIISITYKAINCLILLIGGTLALYSLLCRHAKVKTIPNQHRTDEDLTTYSRSTFHEHSIAAKTKRWLEAQSRRKGLLILVLVGTCMVIGDGILTPAISGNHELLIHFYFAYSYICNLTNVMMLYC